MEETVQDYNKIMKEEIASLSSEKEKPTLFLHACCGPCLTYPLSVLTKYFKVTVGFFNPNIYPVSEYEKRLQVLESFVQRYAKDEKLTIDLVINEEDFSSYQKSFECRKDDREGGNTCLRCHAYRMGLAYRYAALHHFDYFTTVMTVSSKKPSQELNEIGIMLSKNYPETKYLLSDFKKEGGQLKGILIGRKYNLYRQNYCGCYYSLLERMKEEKKKSQLSENSLQIRR